MIAGAVMPADASSSLPSWIWIPIVLAAAVAQTARNAAQRSLVASAGTLGATLSRFLYGLPFAAAWVLALATMQRAGGAVPPFGGSYFGWLVVGAVSQLLATAAMLIAMKQRNFVVGAAYSKTDALQVAAFSTVMLHELPGWATMLAILLATTGVVLLSVPKRGPNVPRGLRAWFGPAALYGLASGALFAISAVGYRGAALSMPGVAPWLIGAWGVLLAQALQTVLLGGWLLARSPQSLRAIFTAWRVSAAAGTAGALASIGWFTSLALTSAANVRAVGMIEVVFSYLVSRRLLEEMLTPAEQAGLLLVAVGLVALCAQF